MSKIILTAIALSLAFMSNVKAEEKPFVAYSDALKTCGAEWRSSDARKAVEKGKGREAWNTFRAECVIGKGYVKGRKPAAKAN